MFFMNYPFFSIYKFLFQKNEVTLALAFHLVSSQLFISCYSHLLLSSMTNLDRILKSRDITLPAKVRIVKAMVFPVVMHVCESWTVQKAEHRRIDAFEL